MKYGIMVFKETINIGDDIQSYAAYKRLPKVDYFIERENMNDFVSKDGSKVKTLVSGWFLRDRYKLPLSPYLNPALYISCHFSSLNDGLGVSKEYLTPYVVEHIKHYEPIGCRDTSTKKLLSEKGIDTYLSYCLTLTIPKFKNVKKQKKIVLVDVPSQIKEKVSKEYDGKIKEVTHTLDKEKNSKLSYEERMNNVESLLKEYQSAEFVITTRLHCALPCLAIETPVLFIYDDKNIDVINRISDYIDFLDYCSLEEFISKKLSDSFVKEPKKKHFKVREHLIKKVNEFIENDNVDEFEVLDYKEEMLKNIHHMNEVVDIYMKNYRDLNEKFYSLEHDFINMKYAKEYWEKEFYILLSKYEKLKGEFEDSRSVSKNNTISKIRKNINRRKK